LKAFIKNFFHQLAIAKLSQFIGLSNGAISIAQITTATEFCRSHSAAIELDKKISIQYSLSQAVSSFTFFATISFSQSSRARNSILLKKSVIFSSKLRSFSGVLLLFSSFNISFIF